MYIDILSYSSRKKERINDLENIFFDNTAQPITSDHDREKLFNAYAKPYIDNWPDDVFFACDLYSHETLGYLIGCRDSQKAASILNPNLKSYSLFADLFASYPAHFHMNTAVHHQGQGVGAFLIQEYFIELRKHGVKGAHVVTSPHLRNVNFYKKFKMSYTAEREFNGKLLLFMGRKI